MRKRYKLSFKYHFYYHPESQHFTAMSPDEFLDLAAKPIAYNPKTGETKLIYSKSAIEKLEDRMRREKEIDPLFLDVDSAACKVIGHEGRHRALAAKRVGIDKLPIILYCRRGGYPVGVTHCAHCLADWRRNLRSEDWPGKLVGMVREGAITPAQAKLLEVAFL